MPPTRYGRKTSSCYNSPMSIESSPEKTAAPPAGGLNKPIQAGAVISPVIHRVCIQCNNMFRVTPDRFDAKQCPNCHKG